jgi:hypothetical protein
MMSGLEPYLILVLVGFLPSEVWRWLGIALGRGLDENSEIVLWVRAVATALVAGVIAKMLLAPGGALATTPAALRIVAAGIGLAAYLVLGRRLFVGVAAAEAVLIAGWLALDP